MKRLLIYIVPALALCIASTLLAQNFLNPSPHVPLVVATYSYQNQTGPIAPFTLVSPNKEGGFYRVSTYVTTTAFRPGNTQVCPVVTVTTDDGGPFSLGAIFDTTASDPQLFCLAGTGQHATSGTVVVHVPAQTPLTYSVLILQLPQPPVAYSAYIVVEHL